MPATGIYRSNQMAALQCPQCGALWKPDTNEIMLRMNTLKLEYTRLQKRRDRLMEEHHDDTSHKFKFEMARLKTDLAATDHAIRCLREELKGSPVQLWQLRYEKALEVAKDFLSDAMYEKFKQAVDEACRPKGLR